MCNTLSYCVKCQRLRYAVIGTVIKVKTKHFQFLEILYNISIYIDMLHYIILLLSDEKKCSEGYCTLHMVRRAESSNI